MAPPTWVVGQVLTASDVNSWFVPVVAYKASDQSVTSSTTLVDCTGMGLAVAANATYWIDGYLFFTQGTSGSSDLKWGWTFPAGLTMRYAPLIDNIGGNQQNQVTNVQTDVISVTTSSTGSGAARFSGTVQVSSTAGTLQFQFAQNTSSGTATIIKKDSCIKLTRVT